MRMQRLKKEGKINIPTASMSDIAFLLLIFFMVSTVFRKEIGLKVTLPEARATERIVKFLLFIISSKNNSQSLGFS